MKDLQKKTAIGILGLYLLLAVCILVRDYQIPYVLVCMEVETEEAESIGLTVDSDKGTIKSVIYEGQARFLIPAEFRDMRQMTLSPDSGTVVVDQIKIYNLGIPAGSFGREELEAGRLIPAADGTIGIEGTVIQKIEQALRGDRNCKILFLLLGTAGYGLAILLCLYCRKRFQRRRGHHLERWKEYVRENRILLGVCGLATVFYLWWYFRLPQWGTSGLPHDDSLFVEWGVSLVKGEWLGAYGNRTLIKRPVYALFAALCHGIGLPVLWGLGLFHVLSVCVFMTAFRKVFRGRAVKGILYVYLLFLPVMYGGSYVQGTSRMGVIPPLVMMATACLSAVYLRRSRSLWELIPWEIAAGVFAVAFWNVREDSVWLLPFIAGAVVFTVLAFVLENKVRSRRSWIKVVSFVFPLLCIPLGNGVLRAVNHYHYGVFTTSELDDSAFGNLINTIYSVEQDEEIEYVQVNHSTVEKLYEASPSLASIKPQIEAVYESSWQTWGTGKDDGEIEGGYFLWGLRDALDRAGYYENAVAADDFCKKAAGELERAFEGGQLRKQKRIVNSSLFNKWKDYYPSLLADKIAETVGWIVNYQGTVPGIAESSGTESELRQIEILYGRPCVRPSRQQIYLNGWCFALEEGAQVDLYLVADGSEARRIEVSGLSPDVYEYFMGQGLEYQNAGISRFELRTETGDFERLELEIYVDGILSDTVDLLDERNLENQIESENYILHADRLEVDEIADPLIDQSGPAVAFFTGAAFLYRGTGIILALLGVLGMAVVALGYFLDREDRKRYHFGEVSLILLGMAAVFAALTFGVSYTYVEAWNSQNRLIYMAGGFAVAAMFIGLSVGTAAPYVYRRIKNRRRKEQ